MEAVLISQGLYGSVLNIYIVHMYMCIEAPLNYNKRGVTSLLKPTDKQKGQTNKKYKWPSGYCNEKTDNLTYILKEK